MRRTPSKTVALIGVCLALFIALALLVKAFPIPSFDLALIRDVQSVGGARVLELMQLISFPGNLLPALVLAGLTAVVLFFSPLRFVLLPLALIVPADGVTAAVKEMINRPRPPANLVNIHSTLHDPAFPSGHVVHYLVFFGFLAFVLWQTKVLPRYVRFVLVGLMVTLVLAIPFSRVYLGAHWPTDVVAGYLLGGSILLLQLRWFQRLAAGRSGAK